MKYSHPTESDFLNSNLRANILTNLPRNEIEAKLILGDMSGQDQDGEKWVLKDGNNPLMTWQKKGALDHWKGMSDACLPSLCALWNEER